MATKRTGRARQHLMALGTRIVSWLGSPGLGASVAPLVLPAVLIPWLWLCWRNCTHGLLYRDTTMFLYVAWCVRHGERLYDTVAMPDGPLVCLLHMLLQGLAGSSERAIRVVDILLHAVGAGAIGAILVPPRIQHRAVACVVWALVSASCWWACLFHWAYGETVMRESYYALLTLLGFALLFASGERGPRGSTVALVLGGVFVALPVFGKQTNAVFVLLAFGTLALEPSSPTQSRLRRVGLAAAGLAGCTVLVLGFVAIFGSLRGYWFWSFDYVTTFYRFIDRRTLIDVVKALPKDLVPIALICSVVGALAVTRGLLSARAFAFAGAPALALAGAVLQQKGWDYHYIPAAAMTEMFWVFLGVRTWHGAQHSKAAGPTLAIALAAWVGVRNLDWLQTSRWMNESDRNADDAELLAARETAGFIASHVDANQRVFYYGQLTEIPLFAHRRPATPYIVPWLAFGGKGAVLKTELLTPEQRAGIDVMRASLTGDLCAKLVKEPPAAVATTENWCVDGDCVKEIGGFCPTVPAMLAEKYLPPTAFGPNRVYLLRSSADVRTGP
jgi:hypothetical protein